ncbi:unnamed protein product [Ectocarpus sp. 12 AP-2014]
MGRILSGGKSGSEAQGAMSSSGFQVEHRDVKVAMKAGKSEISEDEEEQKKSPTVEATSEAGTTCQERQEVSEDTHEKDRGDEEDKEDEEGQEAPCRGKRMLGGTGNPSHRQSVRAAGRPRPNYAESPTRESSKRQRKASESGTGEDCGGGEAVQQRRRQRDHPSDTTDRHNAGVARGTAAQHGQCTTAKADFCSKRAKRGMVHFGSRRCGDPGCMRQSSFGNAGGKANFCSQHARQGMVDLVHKRCDHPGCIKTASFGKYGSKKREFCSPHALEGMVNLVHKSCGHPGCMTYPSYGVAGSKKAEFCSQHSRDGMVNVRRKR